MSLGPEPGVETRVPPSDAVIESWGGVIDKTGKLGKAIMEFCGETPVHERFDRMVVLPRGGYFTANILSRVFGFSSVEILHLGLNSYPDGSVERAEEFEIGQVPTFTEVMGLNMLVIDEVCDSGRTLREASSILKGMKAADVKTAVLHYKPEKSRRETGFVPDFYVAMTERWIDYPWEPYERLGAEALKEEIRDAT